MPILLAAPNSKQEQNFFQHNVVVTIIVSSITGSTQTPTVIHKTEKRHASLGENRFIAYNSSEITSAITLTVSSLVTVLPTLLPYDSSVWTRIKHCQSRSNGVISSHLWQQPGYHAWHLFVGLL